jgi:hypothetical protein
LDASDHRSRPNVPAIVHDAIGGRLIMPFTETRPLTLSGLPAISLIAKVPFVPSVQLTIPSTQSL